MSSESPIKATCSECRVKKVGLLLLLKQGIIPKHIAETFLYIIKKTKSYTVKKVRVVTSEKVKYEVRK